MKEVNKNIQCDVSSCVHNCDCRNCTLGVIKITCDCTDCTCCGSYENKN